MFNFTFKNCKGAGSFDFVRFFIPYFSGNIWSGLDPKMFVKGGSNNGCKLFDIRTTALGKEVVVSGWGITDIAEAIKNGFSKLPTLDPF